MGTHRSRFGRWLGLALLVSAATWMALPAIAQFTVVSSEDLPNGVAAGDVTQTSAVLWAHSTVEGFATFEVATDEAFVDLVNTISLGVADPTIPVRFQVPDLTPGTRYYYRFTASNGAESRGTFRTPDAPGTSPGARFGVSGDWRGELSPYPAITNAPERDLDFFIELGDTIYADFPSPAVPEPQAETLEEYRAKHDEVYSERFGLNAFKSLRESTAILATIDDHEVTNDFAGGAPPESDPRFADSGVDFINDTELYENGLQAFQEYNPLMDEFWPEEDVEPRMAGERKLYRQRRYGDDLAVFILDARSFRDEELTNILDPTDQATVVDFLINAFDPTRTMLGQSQLLELLGDLLQADLEGVQWKFVVVPEPIQNLGPLAAADRFEGYAAERALLLFFIDRFYIPNVVFVAADLHGTLVNNVTYQLAPFAPQLTTGAFEVITGAVAFDEPFGPTVVDLAAAVGLISPEELTFYESLPREGKDQFLTQLINQQLALFGYDLMGLQGSSVDATLVQGDYVRAHTYGWTEFDVAEDSGDLTVTTYGIDPYGEDDLAENAGEVVSREPEIVQQFVVEPTPRCQPGPTTLCLGNGRFRATVGWEDFQGGMGPGQANLLNETVGYFWFFDPANPELVVKILDAREMNGNFQAFVAALTNVPYVLTIEDLQTGVTRVYENPSMRFRSFADLEAFPQLLTLAPPAMPGRTFRPLRGSRARPLTAPGAGPIAPLEPIPDAGQTGCVPTETALCLTGDRFRVELEIAEGGAIEVGQAVRLTTDGGYFWITEAANPEVIVKVLDGRPVNGRFWVFFGGLTDAELELRVTDTATGAVSVYQSPAGTAASVGDTAAFP